jgi:hypothetical protein
MNNETKTQTLGNIFHGNVTFNGPMFDIHDNAHVVIHNSRMEEPEAESEYSPERLARAIEGVQSFFWAQSAWAVVYCVCRDHLGLGDNMNEFERMVEALPLRAGVCSCPPGTVRKTVLRNDFMRYPLHRWPEGRASKLAQQLIGKLAEESTKRDAERP